MQKHRTNKKVVLIRCIVDKQKGFGNMSRCITLAEELRRKSYQICFIIQKENDAITTLQKRNFEFKIIPNMRSKKQESFFLTQIMYSMKSVLLIVDMREYGEELTRYLSNHDFKTVMIDDAWCKKAYADVIINGTPIKQYHNYKIINKKSHVYVGSRYFIANSSFLTKKYVKQNKKPRIVISMGGSDPDDLTSFIVGSLTNLADIDVRIIVGPFYSHYKKLLITTRDYPNFVILRDVKNMWNELSRADLAISNAGNTLFELAITGVPTICIPVVRHQIPYARVFESKGFALNLGNGKNLNQKTIIKNVSALLANKKLRKKMSKIGSKLVDDRGLSRIVNIIEKTIFTA